MLEAPTSSVSNPELDNLIADLKACILFKSSEIKALKAYLLNKKDKVDFANIHLWAVLEADFSETDLNDVLKIQLKDGTTPLRKLRDKITLDSKTHPNLTQVAQKIDLELLQSFKINEEQAGDAVIGQMAQLFDEGLTAQSVDKKGCALLHKVLEQANCYFLTDADMSNIFNCLRERGADFNTKEGDGNTPLHIAAKRQLAIGLQGKIEGGVVKILCETFGASPEITNNAGQTPADCTDKSAFSMMINNYLRGRTSKQDVATPVSTPAVVATPLPSALPSDSEHAIALLESKQNQLQNYKEAANILMSNTMTEFDKENFREWVKRDLKKDKNSSIFMRAITSGVPELVNAFMRIGHVNVNHSVPANKGIPVFFHAVHMGLTNVVNVFLDCGVNIALTVNNQSVINFIHAGTPNEIITALKEYAQPLTQLRRIADSLQSGVTSQEVNIYICLAGEEIKQLSHREKVVLSHRFELDEKARAEYLKHNLGYYLLCAEAKRPERIEVLKKLLETVDPNSVGEGPQEITPLRMAVACGNIAAVKCLIEHHADVKRFKNDLLRLAKENAGIIELLHQAAPEEQKVSAVAPASVPVTVAVNSAVNIYDRVIALLESKDNQKDNYETAAGILMSTAMSESDKVKFVKWAKEDINKSVQKSVLISAISMGVATLVDAFLKIGKVHVDQTVPADIGVPAFFRAVEAGNEEVVQLFLDNGVNFSIIGAAGSTVESFMENAPESIVIALESAAIKKLHEIVHLINTKAAIANTPEEISVLISLAGREEITSHLDAQEITLLNSTFKLDILAQQILQSIISTQSFKTRHLPVTANPPVSTDDRAIALEVVPPKDKGEANEASNTNVTQDTSTAMGQLRKIAALKRDELTLAHVDEVNALICQVGDDITQLTNDEKIRLCSRIRLSEPALAVFYKNKLGYYPLCGEMKDRASKETVEKFLKNGVDVNSRGDAVEPKNHTLIAVARLVRNIDAELCLKQHGATFDQFDTLCLELEQIEFNFKDFPVIKLGILQALLRKFIAAYSENPSSDLVRYVRERHLVSVMALSDLKEGLKLDHAVLLDCLVWLNKNSSKEEMERFFKQTAPNNGSAMEDYLIPTSAYNAYKELLATSKPSVAITRQVPPRHVAFMPEPATERAPQPSRVADLSSVASPAPGKSGVQ